jgi:TamB, inner membrane protein subunit of TAM complex
MQASFRAKVRVYLVALAIIIVCDLIALSFEPVRAAAVRTLVATFLSLKGFHLRQAEVRVTAGQADLDHVIITERSGEPFLTADAIDVRYRLRGVHLSSAAIDIEQPHLVLRREPDGSFNAQRLMGIAGSSSKPTQAQTTGPSSALALQLSMKLRNATIDLENPYSPAPTGRHFSIEHLNLSVGLNPGAISRGVLEGTIEAASQVAPVYGTFFENDRTKFATLRARAHDVAVAPVLNLLVSSPAFILERGEADVSLTGYALQWPAQGSPTWHILGQGSFRNGQMSVAPLAAAARDVNGPLTFNDGVLFLPRITGTAAQLPLTAYGSINLVPSPTLNIIVHMVGPLSRARNFFAFSRRMPVHGYLEVAARIDGAPADPRVMVVATLPRGARYSSMLLSSALGSLVYFHNHLTFPMIAGRYQGFSVYGNGDVFVPPSNGTPSGQFVLALRGPSGAIPWLANLEHSGTLSARASLDGQLTKLEGSGFVHLSGPSASARTAFAASGNTFTLGPLLASDPHGGSLWLGATINRQNEQQAAADFIADHFALALNNTKIALPGVFNRPYGTPQLSVRLNGGATISGLLRAPQFGLRLALRNLTMADLPYGDMRVAGMGEAGLAWLRVTGNHARIMGVPFKDANMLVGLTANSLHIFDASADAAGGHIALMGDWPIAPQASYRSRELFAMAQGIQLASLRELGVPVATGAVSLIGTIGGSATQPHANISGVLSNADLDGRELSGDTQLDYNGSRLTLGDTRLLFGNGSALTASGTIDNLAAGASPSRATLNLTAAADEANIADLAGPNMPAAFPISGSIDANVHISGPLSSPTVAGRLDSPVGTVRGVTYEDLRGAFDVAHGAVSLAGGHVLIGNSSLDASGTVSPSVTEVQVASPHMDLSDFNDFFNGADVLEGTGAMRLAMGDAGTTAIASGALHFNGAEIAHVPLDKLNARLSTDHGTIVADVTQSGLLAQSVVRTNIAFPTGGAVASDFGHATYRLSASSKNIDVAMLTPLLPSAAEGLRGRLNFEASASGPAQHLAANAHFNLERGFFGKDPINVLNGSLAADSGVFQLESLHLAVSDVDLTAQGMYRRDGTLVAHTLLQTANIADVARLAAIKLPVTGKASLAVDASGTIHQPHVRALLTATQGSAYGVSYRHIDVDSSYAPGGVVVRDASVQFPKQAGTVVAAGTAPVPYGPQAEDPPGIPALQTPLDLRVRTSGLDLSVLNPLLGPRGSLGGKLDFEAQATGSMQRPILAGSAAVRNATVKTQLESVPLTALNGRMSFANNLIQLSNLHGVLGKGSITVNAAARIVPSGKSTGGPGRLAYSAHVVASNANLAVARIFSGVLNANLSLRSGPPIARLVGSLAISDATIPFAGILALASGTPSGPPQAAIIPGVPPLRKGHTISYAGSIYGPNVYTIQATPKPVKSTHAVARTPIALDLTATAGNNVQTTGLVDVTGAGSLHIGGTASSPVIRGPINLVRGQFSLFDTTFDLERGDVAFHPEDGFLPTVDVAAAAYRPEAEVTVMVSGRVDQLHTDIESDPPMTQDQILANILHIGDINNALSGGNTGQSVNAGSAATGLVTSALSSPIFSALNYGLEQTLHIQEVNLALGMNGSPELELRKQWGRNVYAMYRQSFASPPQQIYGLSYVVRDNFELDFEQEQNPPGSVGEDGLEPIWKTMIQATAHFNTGPEHKRLPKTKKKSAS